MICIPFVRLVRSSFLIVAACLIGQTLIAQSDRSNGSFANAVRPQSGSSDNLRSRTFDGTVLAPNGSAYAGAVVVSSAGGQTVTDSGGNFQLEVSLSEDVTSIQVTAIGLGGGNLVASNTVDIRGVTGKQIVDALKLASSSGCNPSWLPTFGQEPGVFGFYFEIFSEVYALAAFDDGSGPALFVSGLFQTAGGATAGSVAKWDGTTWSAFGDLIGLSYGYALTTFDDGNGEALYLGGAFSSVNGVTALDVAKWDGANWTALGTGMGFGWVSALTVFDDGSGDALFAGGFFPTAGGVTANGIAKWDGSNWTALASGFSFGVNGGRVHSLHTFDDGGGAALYAGGEFDLASGVTAENIAKWDGTTWSEVGGGIDDEVFALTVFDDGGGAELYAGGKFLNAGGASANRIAKWDGADWSAIGSGMSHEVEALGVYDDGSGTKLYAGGDFITADGVSASRVASWDGTNWAALGTGTFAVKAFTVYDDGSGAKLIVGGAFTTAGGIIANRVASWDGSDWGAYGDGLPAPVQTLTVFDDGGGAALHVGGNFTDVGGVQVNYIAKWDGATWSALGSGMNSVVSELVVFDDGGGDALYAGGFFTTAGGVTVNRIAKWDGSIWTALGSGTDNLISSLEVFDDGGGAELYAGGIFMNAGGVAAKRIAKWDGSTWSAIGDIDGGPNVTTVSAMAVFDDGGGEALFVGGRFNMAGGIAANRIAKWDGSNWSALGTGISTTDPTGVSRVNALTIFDDGNGAALFVGGQFNRAGNRVAKSIARWDGQDWDSLDNGLSHPLSTPSVLALTTFDDGNGTLLYAGGFFINASGLGVNHITSWDGSSWGAVGGGTDSTVGTFAEFDDGSGKALFVGGTFGSVHDSSDSYLGKWACSSALALSSDVISLSLATGGQQALALDGGTPCAGWFYIMFGSVTGTAPGIDFGGILLPLNFDVFFGLTLNKPGLGAFGNYRGTLDTNGQAQATFTLPALPDPNLIGIDIHHAYLAASVFGVPEFASNAVVA